MADEPKEPELLTAAFMSEALRQQNAAFEEALKRVVAALVVIGSEVELRSQAVLNQLGKSAFDKIAEGLREANAVAALVAASGHTEAEAVEIIARLEANGWRLARAQ